MRFAVWSGPKEWQDMFLHHAFYLKKSLERDCGFYRTSLLLCLVRRFDSQAATCALSILPGRLILTDTKDMPFQSTDFQLFHSSI